MGALGAAMDSDGLDQPHCGDRTRLLVGLLRTWLGRLVVLGPGGKRILHAMAAGYGTPALRYRHGKAGHVQKLDHSFGHPDLFTVTSGDIYRPIRHFDIRSRVRGRPGARRVHSRPSWRDHCRLTDTLRMARASAWIGWRLSANQPRGRAFAQQPSARDRNGDRPFWNTLSIVCGSGD